MAAVAVSTPALSDVTAAVTHWTSATLACESPQPALVLAPPHLVAQVLSRRLLPLARDILIEEAQSFVRAQRIMHSLSWQFHRHTHKRKQFCGRIVLLAVLVCPSKRTC